MPIRRGIDSNGSFYQYGHQHKYYYNPHSNISKDQAYNNAVRQAQAIHAHAHANGYHIRD